LPFSIRRELSAGEKKKTSPPHVSSAHPAYSDAMPRIAEHSKHCSIRPDTNVPDPTPPRVIATTAWQASGGLPESARPRPVPPRPRTLVEPSSSFDGKRESLIARSRQVDRSSDRTSRANCGRSETATTWLSRYRPVQHQPTTLYLFAPSPLSLNRRSRRTRDATFDNYHLSSLASGVASGRRPPHRRSVFRHLAYPATKLVVRASDTPVSDISQTISVANKLG